MKNITETNIIVGPARLSYMSVFKVRKNVNDEDEYSVTVLIPKEAHRFCPNPKEELAGIAAAIKAAAVAKFKDIPPVFSNCFKDGDKEIDGEGNAKYPGFWFLNAKAKPEYPPVTIDGKRLPVHDGWQSGDWGKVQICFYGYEFKGKKGVSAGLRAVQFLYKDEPFGQATDAVSVAQQFDEVADAQSNSVTAAAGDEYDPFSDF